MLHFLIVYVTICLFEFYDVEAQQISFLMGDFYVPHNMLRHIKILSLPRVWVLCYRVCTPVFKTEEAWRQEEDSVACLVDCNWSIRSLGVTSKIFYAAIEAHNMLACYAAEILEMV